MIEAAVENYLIRRVKELGGEVRKVAWPGRRHAPDRLALFPGFAVFFELKRPGEKPRKGQLREHERLRAAGFQVVVAASNQALDPWLDHFALRLDHLRLGGQS